MCIKDLEAATGRLQGLRVAGVMGVMGMDVDLEPIISAIEEAALVFSNEQSMKHLGGENC